MSVFSNSTLDQRVRMLSSESPHTDDVEGFITDGTMVTQLAKRGRSPAADDQVVRPVVRLLQPINVAAKARNLNMAAICYLLYS